MDVSASRQCACGTVCMVDGLSGFVPQPTRREWSVVLWGGFARLGVWDAGAVLEATEGVGLMPKRV